MSPKVVLFLEDDTPTGEVMRDLIEMSFGDRVFGLVAATVNEAKQLYLKYRLFITVIMVDNFLRTDEATGVDFVHWLRAESNFEGAVVAFSGSHESIQKLLVAGCAYALQKPLQPTDFLHLVQSYYDSG